MHSSTMEALNKLEMDHPLELTQGLFEHAGEVASSLAEHPMVRGGLDLGKVIGGAEDASVEEILEKYLLLQRFMVLINNLFITAIGSRPPDELIEFYGSPSALQVIKLLNAVSLLGY